MPITGNAVQGAASLFTFSTESEAIAGAASEARRGATVYREGARLLSIRLYPRDEQQQRQVLESVLAMTHER